MVEGNWRQQEAAPRKGGQIALIAESVSTDSMGIAVMLVRNAQDGCEQARQGLVLCGKLRG